MHNRLITYEKENELSFGNAFKFCFKAFDRLSDLVPAKYGISVIGKTFNFTRKFGEGMSKATLAIHEGHRLWRIYNEISNENKESAPMITEETLNSYLKDIDHDLAKLNADYEYSQNEIKKYQENLKSGKFIKEFGEAKGIATEIARKEESVINEYEKIINELNKKNPICKIFQI